MEKDDSRRGVDRRSFLKASGAAGAAMGTAGLGMYGYAAVSLSGSSPSRRALSAGG